MPRDRRRSGRYRVAMILLLTLVPAGVAVAQDRGPRFLWGEGRPAHLVIPGGDLTQALDQAAAGNNVPLWTGSFDFEGKTYPYTMVGTDPGAGSRTSTIPVVIVPIRFVFADGTVLSAGHPVCGGTESAASLSVGSPLFQDYPFSPGGTDVGMTQYADAFQRANFWNEVSTISPDYHVLLSASVIATQTVSVPVWAGSTRPGPCTRIGSVGIGFFDFMARRMIARLGIPATSLPVLLNYNTFLTRFGRCCILGYHSATSTSHTYVVATYSDPGLFSVPIEDVNALSHELGEWLDDPFGANPTPGWTAGQATQCQFDLEVGDPVTGVAFSASLNGTTYHPEDLVFLSWFARESPSSAVNGWYTFLNTFASPSPVCQ